MLVSASPDTKLAMEMTSEDWKTIEYGVEILEISENATLQLSKETASISEVNICTRLVPFIFYST